jgi:hypothetical protein
MRDKISCFLIEMRTLELTREVSISNISNSINRPLGFIFVINGIPVYNRIIRTHRQRREPDTNQLISSNMGHNRIDDILDNVNIFFWNSVIPKKIVHQKKTTREEEMTYNQADLFSFALTIDAKKEACLAIKFLSGNIACKMYA